MPEMVHQNQEVTKSKAEKLINRLTQLLLDQWRNNILLQIRIDPRSSPNISLEHYDKSFNGHVIS